MFAKNVFTAILVGVLISPQVVVLDEVSSGLGWFWSILRATLTQDADESVGQPAAGNAPPAAPVLREPSGGQGAKTTLAVDAAAPRTALIELLQKRCGACHIGAEREVAELDMSDFDALVTKGYLAPGRPDDSEIWKRVRDQSMPPSTWATLSPGERQQFQQVIRDLQSKPAERLSIIETGEQDPRLSRFVAWARQNKLIEELLHAPGPFTILAPTNEAIEQLGPANLKYLDENSEALRTTLLNHGNAGYSISLADMVRKKSIETIHSQYIVIRRADETWIREAKVIEADIQCRNGVIHIIDHVLVPHSVSRQFPAPWGTVGPAGIYMSLLPGGRFQMGSPATEDGRRDDESPQHIVQLSPFLLGEFEITRRQYNAILKFDPSDTNMPGRRQVPNDDPVQQISWFDAVEFCNTLSVKDGLQPYYTLSEVRAPEGESLTRVTITQPSGSGYRLPTEAEWEYACRAGGKGAYCFGDAKETLDQYGWFEGNTGGGNQTRAVGGKAPNAFGLHDMHGNVAEWCQDWYGPYPAATMVDPSGPSDGTDRVVRGGSYVYGKDTLRCAARQARKPTWRHRSIGFRVARYPPADLRPGRKQFLEADE